MVLCRNCGLVYLNPRRDQQEYDVYYRDSYFHEFMDYFDSQEGLLKWWVDQGQYILDKTRPYLKAPAKVLEIGCAGGGILDVFKRAGHDVTGLEVLPYWIEFAQKNFQITIVDQDFHALINEKKQFDLIILSHFLEHLLDPVSWLEELKPLLSAGGLIYVETPNIRDIPQKLGLQNYFCLAHTYYFSPDTLKLIIQNSGFEVKFSDVGREVIRYLILPVDDPEVKGSCQNLKYEWLKTLAYLLSYDLAMFFQRGR